ncbi:cysteine proteinase [Exidia glandulosa HHB12029]|uniref:Ubiquitin carboxyl-terminal hydrolase n=1 Tax=Exidia glandulosa HHB12029 TaxID=1314781 RepID=A0A165N0I0_EXIGL|nr:cysteine proteinase [Exidia glandulosa HHB12029]
MSTPRKWIPLESEPQVLNEWAKHAGLATKQYEFCDIYGLDPELLALVPKPVKAVLLVFPIAETIEAQRKAEDARIASEGGQPDVDPSIVFISQTIPNACGTIALLHAILNTDVTIAPKSALARFQEECLDKTPDARGKLLEETEIFASIHATAARGGQSAIPRNNDTDLHYVVFLLAPSPSSEGLEQRVIELDGRRPLPVDHGACADDKLLDAVAKIVQNKYMIYSTSLQFSMIALAPPEA